MVQILPAWSDPAIAAMRATRVPASVSLAQFGDESGWGKDMPWGSNNPFGMKARARQDATGRLVFTDPYVLSPTHEEHHGVLIPTLAHFRTFLSLDAAFMAHAQLIAEAPVYAAAMACLPDLGKFVTAMAAHYATDEDYAPKLMNLIHGDDLVRFDLLV